MLALAPMTFVSTVYLVLAVTSIAYMDFRKLIIPNELNIALAIGGLLYQVTALGRFPYMNLLTAVLIFILLFTVREAFFRIRGIAGLGLGDVKMAAAAALWIDPLNIPLFLMIASFCGIVALGLIRLRGSENILTIRLPFGPFLGVSLLVVWTQETLFLNHIIRTLNSG